MRAVSLPDLLADFTTHPIPARTVSGMTLDSRSVQRGDLFVALAGLTTDGQSFIDDAIARGAAAILFDAQAPPPQASVPAIAVPQLRQCVGFIAARFFGAPSQHLNVIGVTGTNGKTTCTQVLAQVLGHCAVIGTLGAGFPGALRAGPHTTPDVITVQRLLAEFLAAGAKHVCMEVSSHALDQGRVVGVRFALAMFTNLTRDHLDYHGDMTRYGEAKARLFATPHLSKAVINGDDAFGRELIEQLQPRLAVLRFGLDAGDIYASAIALKLDGLAFTAHTPHGSAPIAVRLLGRFNVSNILAVIGAAMALGRELADIAQALRAIEPPPGRMQCFGGERAPLVVVDYAHTPDALTQVLSAAREHTLGELWCVFGCGGNRDRGKRPLMGAVAEQLADRVVVTDDNPRHERSQDIIADIVRGMRRQPHIIPDRAQAIRHSVQSARHGDVVLIAGKGHEDYQQVGDARLPFSDSAAVQQALGLAA